MGGMKAPDHHDEEPQPVPSAPPGERNKKVGGMKEEDIFQTPRKEKLDTLVRSGTKRQRQEDEMMIAKRAKMMELGTMVPAPDHTKAPREVRWTSKVTLNKGEGGVGTRGGVLRERERERGLLGDIAYIQIHSANTTGWTQKFTIIIHF